MSKVQNSTTFISDLSNIEFPMAECISAQTIRRTVFDIIKQEHPEFTTESKLAFSELNYYREKYISVYLTNEIGELTDVEKNVLSSISGNAISSKFQDTQPTLTFGQRLADKIATFGGSWTFIISFGVFITIWIGINVVWAYWSKSKPFDEYPFILLNLILSCLAALQAPVIMMSQNRQEDKDRERSKMDYMVNLKSELEIRTLHEKIDHLIIDQQQELLNIQKVQIEMLKDIYERINHSHPKG